MNTGDLLKKWLDFMGRDYTQKRLAIETGLTESTVSFMINNRRAPETTTIEKISAALGVTISEFWAGPEEYAHNRAKNPSSGPPFKNGQKIPGFGEVRHIDLSDKIPLLTSIPAGPWKAWVDDYPPGVADSTVPRFGVKGPHAFAISVDGDSMIPDLYPQDLLIIDPEMPFTRIRGGIGVVKLNGDYKIRRIYQMGDKYRLEPSNKLYTEEYIPVQGTTLYKIALWIPGSQEEKF